MDVNYLYIVNIAIGLLMLAIGAVGGYFLARGQHLAAKNAGQEKAIQIKNELIASFEKEIEQLRRQLDDQKQQFETEIAKLKSENQRLTGLVDDLVALEEARKRIHRRPAKVSGDHV